MSTETVAKFITTFVLRSPRAAQPALDAIREAGHQLRPHPSMHARGINIDTMEPYEVWQTSMSVGAVEMVGAESNGAVMDVGATPEDWQ